MNVYTLPHYPHPLAVKLFIIESQITELASLEGSWDSDTGPALLRGLVQLGLTNLTGL